MLFYVNSSLAHKQRDGITYKCVKIGNQTWMAENLRLKSDTGCYIPNNNPEYYKMFRLLYAFRIAKKACAEGWHLSSDNEWD